MRLLASMVLVGALAACGSGETTLPAGYNLLDRPADGAVHAVAGLETARGSFEGRGGADASGSVSLFRAEGRWVLSFGTDFEVTGGAAGAVVVLARDEGAMRVELGALKTASGASTYEVGDLDPGDFTEVMIWADSVDAPVAIATLALL